MPGVLDQITDESLERLKKKRFGLYRGIVRDVDDPEEKGRVRVEIHELLGPGKMTDWASYCAPFGGGGAGFFMLPRPGDGIWVMFERGEPAKPVWIGFWYNQVDLPPEGADKEVRVLQSKSGHRIAFTDEEGGEAVEIRDRSGNGVRIDLNGGEVVVQAQQIIRLGSPEAGESLVLGDSFREFLNGLVSLLNTVISTFNSHTHLGFLSTPTTPPVVPISDTQTPMDEELLSTKVKTD